MIPRVLLYCSSLLLTQEVTKLPGHWRAKGINSGSNYSLWAAGPPILFLVIGFSVSIGFPAGWENEGGEVGGDTWGRQWEHEEKSILFFQSVIRLLCSWYPWFTGSCVSLCKGWGGKGEGSKNKNIYSLRIYIYMYF